MALPLLPVDLTWTAPAECPSHDAVLDDVARILSHSSGTRAPASAQAEVARDERGRWHATLRVDARGASSERALEAESCEAIATASALILAIAVEGGMPEPAEPPPTAESKAPAPGPQPAAPARRLPASHLLVAAAGVVDAGMLPGASYGAEAALGWTYEATGFRVRALGSANWFADQDVKPLAGEGGRFSPFAGAIRGCASLQRAAFDVGPCLGAEVDVMTGAGNGSGTGLPSTTYTPSTRLGVWESLLGSIAATWNLDTRLAVFVRADAVVPLNPPTFVINFPGVQPTHVYNQSLVYVRGALGVEARFF